MADEWEFDSSSDFSIQSVSHHFLDLLMFEFELSNSNFLYEDSPGEESYMAAEKVAGDPVR